jgi:REP element-mobilizing transposase RayT
MARHPRIDFPDALYHVTSRGNGRQEIFWTDDDRQRFVGQLADGVNSAAIVLYAFAMLDNHFHLLARTPRANLSQFMQRLNSSYALYARFKHRRPGHQFQGRFKAKLVEDETYLRMLTRYIHLNPIKIATCRKLGRAARVRRLEGYIWSSYPGYVDAAKRWEFVNYDLLADYGRTQPEARRQYRAYVHACVLEDDAPILAAMAASRHAIGGGNFVEETEQHLVGRARPKLFHVGIPGAVERIGVRPAKARPQQFQQFHGSDYLGLVVFVQVGEPLVKNIGRYYQPHH